MIHSPIKWSDAARWSPLNSRGKGISHNALSIDRDGWILDPTTCVKSVGNWLECPTFFFSPLVNPYPGDLVRPEIRNGAGGLLVKAFQGFMEIRGGDKRVGARNVIECAHILVAFPGLCRVSRW